MHETYVATIVGCAQRDVPSFQLRKDPNMITDEDYSQFLTNVLSVVEEELQKGFRPVAFLLDVCDPCALAIASEWCDLPLLSEIVGIPMLHSAVRLLGLPANR